jgi:hypothetical protein
VPQFSFRLLRPDNTVFSEWHVGGYTKTADIQDIGLSSVSIVSTTAVVETVSMDWNGAAFSDERLRPESTGALSMPVLNIVARKECSSLVYGDLIQTVGSDAIRDRIANYQEGSAFQSTSYPGAAVGSFVDADTVSKYVAFSGGVPLSNDSVEFVDSGPLRFAAKFNIDPIANTGGVQVTAAKIYQEGVDCDCTSCYGYEYTSNEINLVESNLACEWPTICPVTSPHYTTPMWEVTSSPPFLNQVEKGYEIAKCVSLLFHRRISDVDAPNLVPNATWPIGVIKSDAEDFPKVFTHIDASTKVDVCLIFTHNGGLLADPANWSAGLSDITFRSDGFPYTIQTTVVATADPCVWKVIASLKIYAWAVSEFRSTNPWSLSVVLGSGSAAAGTEVLLTNPQTDTAFFGSRLVNPLFTAHEYIFEEEVPAWLHEPPEITFDSTNQTNGSPGNYYFLTSINTPTIVSVSNTILDFRVTASTVTLPLVFPYAVTLGPRALPRVPHP